MTDTIKLKLRDIAPAPAKPDFRRLAGILTPPLEISRARLPGLNMVDETIIVRTALRRREGDLR